MIFGGENRGEKMRLAAWIAGGLLALIILWFVAKAALPFAIGLFCGVAAVQFLKK
jgi:predicted PurR-regulated permease PerM